MVASGDGWGPVLLGQRVRLEPIDPPLAGAMLAGIPGPDLAWAEGWPMKPVLGLAEKIAAASEILGPFFAYVIVLQRDGTAIGDAGFHGPPSDAGELEIGYALVPAARGLGLAGEAVRLLIAWAQSQPGVRVITARVDHGNVASERLLNRLGFVYTEEDNGMQRFAFQPHDAHGPRPRRAR